MAMTSLARSSWQLDIPGGSPGKNGYSPWGSRGTARSASRSTPTISAFNCLPSSNVTVRVSAPSTTWLLVSANPSAVMMTPYVPLLDHSLRANPSQGHHLGQD